MRIDDLQFLKLLQIADSALPIGTTAHSFGLETLTAEENLTVDSLEAFLTVYLQQAGTLECTFCRLAYRLLDTHDTDLPSLITAWFQLNTHLSALKTARESRSASATLGRRLLQLFSDLAPDPRLLALIQANRAQAIDPHYSSSFGLLGSLLNVSENLTVLAYLQQSLSGTISACQRLLPLGQHQASQIQWRLKPVLTAIATRSETWAAHEAERSLFTPLVDLGSMRHPNLLTRLFIS